MTPLLPKTAVVPYQENTLLRFFKCGRQSHGDGYTVFGNMTKSTIALYFNSSWLYDLFRQFRHTGIEQDVLSLSFALALGAISSGCDFIVHSTQDGQNEDGHIAAQDAETDLAPKRRGLLVGAFAADILGIAGALVTMSDDTSLSAYLHADNDEPCRVLLLLATLLLAMAASWSEYRGHKNSQIAEQEMEEADLELGLETNRYRK